MPRRPFIVKVCGVTNCMDAQAAIDAGANAIGFNFYPKSPRYISPKIALDLMSSLRGDFLRVGIFVDPAPKELAVWSSSLDVFQIHGQKALLDSPLPIWRAVAAGFVPDPDASVEAWLLDTPSAQHGGTGRTFDWSLAAAFPRPFILAGGLAGDNVAQAIAASRAWGVDACSRLETSLGKKDQSRVLAFVEHARKAFEKEMAVRI